MQPARQNLPIVPGTTYRDTVRLMQPEFAYRAVSGIAGAPARLTVPDHDLVADWPVWFRGVSGMPAANREPPAQLPHRARVVDADTLEINALSATGSRPSGGQLLYRLPVDLTGADVRMSIRTPSAVLELTVGAGLSVPAAGTITRELSPAQTAQLAGDWTYTLEVTFADGTVTRYFEGGPAQAGGCHG